VADVTITLKGEAAERLERLVRDAAYPSPEAAVADALQAFEETRAPELDHWLGEVAGPRLDAMRADPSLSLTADQLRARLFGAG
jgi:Arc/MetJ-type ribon-helix-helix transcriptional regulator